MRHSFCHKFSWIRSEDSAYFLNFAEGFEVLFGEGEKERREPGGDMRKCFNAI